MTAKQLALSALATTLIVFASVFASALVDSMEDLRRIGFGYPFHFIFQNCEQFNPPVDKFPFYQKPLSPWEYGWHFSLTNFLGSWFVLWVLVCGIYIALKAWKQVI